MRNDDNLHQNLRRKKGSASTHPCVGCGEPPMCRSCHRKLDYSKGTPIPSTLARTTFSDRSRGGKNSWKNRKKRGTVFRVDHTRWRAALQHNGVRRTEHYPTKQEAEEALSRMLDDAGLSRKG